MFIDPSKLIALDLETGGDAPLFGLQPWRLPQGTAKIKSYALAWYGPDGTVQQAGKLWPSREDIRAVLDRIAASGRYCVTWNGAFDIAWLVADGLFPETWKINWLDGMLLWRHWMVEPEYDENRNQKRSYNLATAIQSWFPGHGDFKEFEDFDAVDEESLKQLLVRNLGDAKYTLLITEILLRHLSSNPRRLTPALIEAHCMPMVGRANCWGMLVNAGHTYALSQQLDARAADLLAELGPHGVTEAVVRSPKQLRDVLFGQWGLPVIGQTPSGDPSTDKETLYELALLDPRAKKVKEYRETLNNKSKFADALIESLRYLGGDHVHPTARIFGTYTGRMTYSSKVGRNSAEKPISSALHQTKRGRDYRATLMAPQGYDIVEFDAANQEFRWMAIVSGDETMLGLCQPGQDAHGYMGAQIIGVDYTTMLSVLHDENHLSYAEYKNGRQLGKVANLSLQYRTSAKKLRVVAQVQYDVPMTMGVAIQSHGMYQRTYRGVPVYWATAIHNGQVNGYVETLAGRQVQLVDPWDKAHRWMLESTCINYPVQGTGADQKYLALMCMKPVMTKHRAFFWFEMHDGVYFLVPHENTQAFCAEGQHVLTNLPYKRAWGFTPPIPLPWDVKFGPSWGELKEWKN